MESGVLDACDRAHAGSPRRPRLSPSGKIRVDADPPAGVLPMVVLPPRGGGVSRETVDVTAGAAPSAPGSPDARPPS